MCQGMPGASKLKLKEIALKFSPSHCFSPFVYGKWNLKWLTPHRKKHIWPIWLNIAAFHSVLGSGFDRFTACGLTFFSQKRIEICWSLFYSTFCHTLSTFHTSQLCCSKGWSQDQVIFKAAQATAPVRFRPSESSKVTIQVPRALSPTKALKVSLGRVHEWQDAISVKSQRRSAHSEVPPSFRTMEVRLGAIKRKAKGCQLSNSALTETSIFAIW